MIVIGHRGAMAYEPENTFSSFKKALKFGVPMIEFDVHMTSDGKVVVLHDETVNRTTNGSGRVDKLPYAQIKELDAGFGQPIPTLF